MTADPAGNNESGDPNKISDPKLYEDCGKFDDVSKKFNNLLLDYNEADGNKEMTLVLFKDALFHLTKIFRIIRLPRGHVLNVGFGGSGK
jgi:dynein heavy chain